MKHLIFCVAFMFSAASQAFTLNSTHCDIMHKELTVMVAQKAAKAQLDSFKKYLVAEKDKASNKEAFAEIIPFIEAAADEYYTSEDELPTADYASAISYNCMMAIGDSTPSK